jgi:tetratricopeptide (TPR) repeat protein
MNINKALLVALVLSIGLAGYLAYKGFNSYTVQIPDASALQASSDHLSNDELLDKVTAALDKKSLSSQELSQLFTWCEQAHEKELLSNEQLFQYAKLKIDNSQQPMEMMAGIRVLKELEKTDSNNVEVLEILGSMSVQSGQLEKAKKRYQKLLSLQPENDQYRKILEDICRQMGDSDCF